MIGAAIRSVIAQTYADWELVVVDDGSEDNTQQVVRSYSDARITYLYQGNAGTSAARNTGIRSSTGTYMAFLDSDDRYLPDMLQLLITAAERNPTLGLVASGWIEVDAQARPLRTVQPWQINPGLTLTDWLYGCPMIMPAFLVRRSCLDQIGLFDEQLRYVEDWDLWLRLVHAGCRMAWEPGTVCERTVHEHSKIRDVAAMSDGAIAVLDKFYAQPDLPDEIIRQREGVYARTYVGAMVRAFGAGLPDMGAKLLSAAIHLDPKLLEGEPPLVLQGIASSALTHQVPDKDRYVRDIAKSLPGVSPRLARSTRQLKALIRATAAFDARAAGRRYDAYLYAIEALVTDPIWFRNRGLLRILLT